MAKKMWYHVENPDCQYEIIDQVVGAGDLHGKTIVCYLDPITGKKYGRLQKEFGSRMLPVAEESGVLSMADPGIDYQDVRDFFLRGGLPVRNLGEGYSEKLMIWLFGRKEGPKKLVELIQSPSGHVVLPDTRLLTDDRVLVSMVDNTDWWDFAPIELYRAQTLLKPSLGSEMVSAYANFVRATAIAWRYTPQPNGEELLTVVPLALVGKHHVALTYRSLRNHKKD